MMDDKRAGEPVADDLTLSLFEERLVVGKTTVATGKVRVATRTETVEELAQAVLHGEAVEVTHVAIDQPVVGPPPQVRVEGDVTIVPILEEVLVVETRLILKEEVHIRRRATQETVSVPVTLRRQSATVERLDVAPVDRAGGDHT